MYEAVVNSTKFSKLKNASTVEGSAKRANEETVTTPKSLN